MRFLSVCSGIEAASVAWAPLGWQASAFAEIDPFASAVLAHRYPEVPNLGDIQNFQEWPDLGSVDLVCGGTPCQSFSLTGLRQGLADPRGSLALSFLSIVGRYRPTWVVWENVAGVLTSSDGRDFACLVGGLASLGYGWCYRVLDARYARVDGFERAVPQRRRRVWVVGHLGDWRPAVAVLSEPESLLGNAPPRCGSAEAPPARVGAGAHGDDLTPTAYGGNNTSGPIEVAPSILAQPGAGYKIDFETETFIVQRSPLDPTRPAARRLTPTECERLMGFPDGYTDIPYRGRRAADGPRYKALGNSWAVNAARWVGRRIELVREVAAEIQKEPRP
jgi:DNA (cytosine-5)-methyltransferase 1